MNLNKEVKIQKEIDLLLKPMEYLKLVQIKEERRILRKQQENIAVDELLEVIAKNINNGSKTGFIKSLFHLKDGDLIEVVVAHKSRDIIQQRAYDFYITKGYIIDFIQKNTDEPGFEYIISAFEIDDGLNGTDGLIGINGTDGLNGTNGVEKVEDKKEFKAPIKSYIGNYELQNYDYKDQNHSWAKNKNFF
jgi:hypothetical protein